MKKIYISLAVILLTLVIFVIYIKTETGNDALVIPATSDLIYVTSPKPDSEIFSPVIVSGKARGSWYFEASFPILVLDAKREVIGEGIATAKGDWMTNDFVPFEGTVTFTNPADVKQGTPFDERGTLVFKKDNPSGEAEREASIEIPVKFK